MSWHFVVDAAGLIMAIAFVFQVLRRSSASRFRRLALLVPLAYLAGTAPFALRYPSAASPFFQLTREAEGAPLFLLLLSGAAASAVLLTETLRFFARAGGRWSDRTHLAVIVGIGLALFLLQSVFLHLGKADVAVMRRNEPRISH